VIFSPNGSPPIARAGRGAHVLVVDGDDELTEETRAHLEAAGYDVSTADMPDIGIVRRVEPDVIVLGVFYRGRSSGLDFLEHHASDPRTAGVPVIVRVADGTLDSEQRSRLLSLNWPVLSPDAVTGDLLRQIDMMSGTTGG
jgi:CheY-like chemotaxis protein